MDVTFHCHSCHQELEADASLSGTSIQCPACSAHITIPAPDLTNVKVLNAMSTSAAAKEEKHFVVPVRDGPTEVLIKKPKEVEVTPRDGKPHIRVKTIRRIDCVEVGHDRFDEIVTHYLDKVGQENVISVNSVTYTHIDIGSQKILTDFGIIIVHRA
jgi:DNA-directed RNA polymerase subunit RPC12/RpoP